MCVLIFIWVRWFKRYFIWIRDGVLDGFLEKFVFGLVLVFVGEGGEVGVGVVEVVVEVGVHRWE